MGRTPGAALAWLGHPITLLSLAVLAVNDHLLKTAYPGLVTGKLSDLAGLVVAPPLLALAATLPLPRLPGRPVAAVALLATGAGFLIVKATGPGAAAASAGWSVVNGPSVILADLTDLVALPALALSWWAWTRAARRPAPARLVRLARALVVLPAATFAVAATSAPAYPHAVAVAEWDGALVVGEAIGFNEAAAARWDWQRRSNDGGATWRDLREPERAAVEAEIGREPPALACEPGRPTHCYRPVPGELAVEETHDHGYSWTVSWRVSADQRERLRQQYRDLEDPDQSLVTRAVAVVPARGGHLVVAANGRDGYAVRDVHGNWERIGFGADSPPYFADPPPLGSGPPPFSYGYLWGLVGALLCLLVVSELLRRQRAGSWRWLDKAGVGLVGAGVVAAFTAVWGRNQLDWTGSQSFLLWVPAVALLLIGLVVWSALLVVGRVLSLRQWLVAAPAALVTGAFVALPLVDRLPVPGGFPVAVIAAVLFWGAGTAAGTTMAWAVERQPVEAG